MEKLDRGTELLMVVLVVVQRRGELPTPTPSVGLDGRDSYAPLTQPSTCATNAARVSDLAR
jgi:hypothetical protein